jgi:uncharacterized damage-inducible protein DinB
MMDAIYRELLRGRRAHVDPIASLEDVPAVVAGRTIEGYPHSIWQIVGHMNYWMEYEIRRIAGEHPAYPEHAIQSWPASLAPASEQEWLRAKEGLAAGIERLGEISQAPQDVLERPVEAMHEKEQPRSTSVEAVLWQIMVHNSYHVGQIAMMLRCFGKWPPPAGGDSW